MTQLTIPGKVRNSDHDIEWGLVTDSQGVLLDSICNSCNVSNYEGEVTDVTFCQKSRKLKFQWSRANIVTLHGTASLVIHWAQNVNKSTWVEVKSVEFNRICRLVVKSPMLMDIHQFLFLFLMNWKRGRRVFKPEWFKNTCMYLRCGILGSSEFQRLIDKPTLKVSGTGAQRGISMGIMKYNLYFCICSVFLITES